MPEQSQEKDLRKLKRSELLEIMLAQSEEIDRLRKELAQKDAELQDRTIKIQNAGSIAEASLQLTKVFEEAQRAADLYLANVAPGAVAGGAKNVAAQGASAPATAASTASVASRSAATATAPAKSVTPPPNNAPSKKVPAHVPAVDTPPEHFSSAEKTTVLAPLSATPQAARGQAAKPSDAGTTPKHLSN